VEIPEDDCPHKNVAYSFQRAADVCQDCVELILAYPVRIPFIGGPRDGQYCRFPENDPRLDEDGRRAGNLVGRVSGKFKVSYYEIKNRRLVFVGYSLEEEWPEVPTDTPDDAKINLLPRQKEGSDKGIQ